MSERTWTLANLLIPTVGFGAICFWGIPAADPVRWAVFGLGLPIFPAIAQAVLARRIARVKPELLERWSRGEFTRYLVGGMLGLAAPPGLFLALLGFGWHSGRLFEHALPAVLLAFALWLGLWVLMWRIVREMRVPGRLVSFPSSARLTEVERLARRMDAPLRAVMLSRTRSARLAAAYCLGRSRVCISDALLAALTPEEFLAVMAHELRHLSQARQTAGLLLLWGSATLAVGAGFAAVPLLRPLALSAIAVGLLGVGHLVRLKRRQEDEADEAAVAFVGAMPLISALVKTTLLNGGSFDRRGVRHRGLTDRIARLTHLGGLSAETVELKVQGLRREFETSATQADPRLATPIAVR